MTEAMSRTATRAWRALLAAAVLAVAALGVPALAARAYAAGPSFDPSRIVVGLRGGGGVRSPGTPGLRAARFAPAAPPGVRTIVLHLRRGEDVHAALLRLRASHGVAWAVPDYVAHAADAGPTNPATAAVLQTHPNADIADTTGFVPDDVGDSPMAGGWELLQWNFVGIFGVNAPRAWANVGMAGGYGGRGVTIAVLDTGIAYEDHGRFRRSPDFAPSQFVAGRDFVDGGDHPDDHNGHGTHVAGTIAEATNNRFGLTGLAYGARLMPVRVLDSSGEGDASVIAQGVRWAVRHGAQIINLSLEFSPDVTARDIPELLSALRFAHALGVTVVAAAGNEGEGQIAYPARASKVIAIGSSTEHGCVSDFSNWGAHLALVAPGGGDDSDIPADPNCHPALPPGRDIYQVTFTGLSPRRFGIPAGYDGTSMAAPEVTATAALVIASGVIGRRPSPDALLAHLQATARPLGTASDHYRYGAGLVDAAAATTPGPIVPQAPAPTPSG
jgi:serine protease